MAVVVPFPASARVGLIRKTASRIFHSRTDREATSNWRRAADAMFRQIDRVGIERDQSEAEVIAFHRQVCAEMDYLAAVSVEPNGTAA